SGLRQMDFMWSDQVSIPQDMEEFVVEKVVRLPTSSLCFLPSRTLDLKPPTDSGLHPFRCGFLGKPEQISEPLLAAMQSILVSISDAELVFSGLEYRDKAFQHELREKFSRTPDVTDRIRFECFESDEAELNSYQQLDVTLDPFLVSSPQRSFESLWMGVPVVTLLDKRMSARGTASILQALGSQHWIANSPSEYVNLVKQLAESRDQWRSRRPQLRAALLASPMCDAAAIAQSIQDAIKQSIRQSPFAATPT
ncbi:MAG: hypothetical protein SFV81_13770, partial [Pirellulaceae bacterium]|nr:hypothetical protein [Pirellulaceae bacterium]